MHQSIMDHEIVVYLIMSVIIMCNSNPNYGPFKLKINKFDLCAGPRSKNCTIMDSTVSNGAVLMVNFKVIENVTPSKGKILALSNGKELVRLQMNKPCEHLFLKPLFETMFTVPKGCMVLKGEYKLKLDMETIATDYFGGKFFYGNISFRAVFYGSQCNFSCTHLFLTLTPNI